MALQRSALWAVALTAFALAVPAPASADHGTTYLDDDLATYFGIAQAYWAGPMPTCVANGVTTIPVHAVLHEYRDPSVAARSDQPGCRLSLDRTEWPRLSRPEACMIVVHEWGHLMGFGHTGEALSIMAEFPTRVPSACAALVSRRRSARASVRRRLSCAVHAKRLRRLRTLRLRKLSLVCPRRLKA